MIINAGSKRMLVVEDDENLNRVLSLEFSERNLIVESFISLTAEFFANSLPFDYAIIDLKLGCENGLDTLKEVLETSPNCRAVILTGYGSVVSAVRAIKMGAINFLIKPASVDTIWKALNQDHARVPSEPEYIVPVSLARIQREHIEKILMDCGGNISNAAKALGIHRQSLQRMLRKFSPK